MRRFVLALLILSCSAAYAQFGLFSSEPPDEFMSAPVSLGGIVPDYDMTATEFIAEINAGFQGTCENEWVDRADRYILICPWEETKYEMQIHLGWDELRGIAVLSLFERTLGLTFSPYDARVMLDRFPTTTQRQADRQAEQERRERLRGEHWARFDALPDYDRVYNLCVDRIHKSYRSDVDALGYPTAESQRRLLELSRQFTEQRNALQTFSANNVGDLYNLQTNLRRRIGEGDPELFNQLEADYMREYREYDQAVNAMSNGCRFVAE